MSVLILHFYLLLKKFMGAQTKESTCIYLYGQFWKKFISNVVAQRRRLHRESGSHRSWIESKREPGWAFLAGRGLCWTRCRPHNQWCPWKLLISVSIGSELFRTCTSSCKSSPSRRCGFCRSSSPRWLCSRSRCCSRSRQGRCCTRRCWQAGVQGWVVAVVVVYCFKSITTLSCWSVLVWNMKPGQAPPRLSSGCSSCLRQRSWRLQ